MNRKKIVVKTTEYIFYGITAIQVLFGLVWGFCQFPHMQNWQETYEYLDISKTWVMDEYVSFLYPLLLKLCTGIESLAGIPFYMSVYVIQLAATIFAGWFFARKVVKLEKNKAVWAVGYLTSFPMLLQFHMSVRTESLELSGILVLLTFFETSPVGAVIMTLLLIWLNPDMAIICVVAWIVYLLRELFKIWKEKKAAGTWNLKGLFIRCGAFILALVIGLSVNALVQTPGNRGRIQKTFWAAAFQRVVSEYFSKSYGIWYEEIKTTFTVEEAMEMAKRSDNMMYEVGPALETDWGKEKANEFYQYMATTCFRLRTREIVYQIRDDLVDSALMPFSILWQDNGERMSQTGWNYGRFRNESPTLSQLYMRFSIIGLVVSILLSIIKKVSRERTDSYLLIALIIAVTQCLHTVLCTGNAVNYNQLLLVILFWCLCSILGIKQNQVSEGL